MKFTSYFPPRRKWPGTGQYVALEELGQGRTVSTDPASQIHSWRDGHHLGILSCLATAAVVLLLNVSLTIASGANHNVDGGYGILQHGDCNNVKRTDLWLHLLINVLSTLLLGASNYTMQCSSAPTREDLDSAHKRGRWLDIGVPSMRNLGSIAPWRRVIWIMLLLSSVPLHLFYNSVVFASIEFSEWSAFAVDPSFLTGRNYTLNKVALQEYDTGEAGRKLSMLKDSKSLVRLDNDACIKAYAPTLQSAWSSVLVVTTQENATNSFWNVMAVNSGARPTDWTFCALLPWPQSRDCGSKQPIRPDAWSIDIPGSSKVDHCMALPADQHCEVRFSLYLMLVVILCNCIKVTCIGILAWKMDSRLVVTLGDAVASMLARPDETTQGSCLIGKQQFKSAGHWKHRSARGKTQRIRWFASASFSRWMTTIVLCVITIVAAIVLLNIGTSNLDIKGSIWTLGFGAVNLKTVIDIGNLTLVENILLANSPQLLLSFLYFAYNGLWTCMLMSQEWFSYAQSAKGLRVTSSRGAQRSTYRLQLPYRYGIPLMVMSGLLHWLVSQSIFLLLVSAYDKNEKGQDVEETSTVLNTCGYSPSAILTAILVGSVTLIFVILNGFRRFPATSMPLAGSCSAAISAACHPPPNDHEAHLKKVQWGVCGIDSGEGAWKSTEGGSDNRDACDGGIEAWRRPEESRMQTELGHCSFTSMLVTSPVESRRYAGLRKTSMSGSGSHQGMQSGHGTSIEPS